MKTPRRAVLAAMTASALLFTGCSPGDSGQERDTPPDGVPAADDVVAGLAAGAEGPGGEETSWDGDAKEGADVTGTVVGASGVGKVEETESEATGSLLPQFPQKACPSLASLPQFRQNIRIPFMRFPGQTRSAPSRASERWFWHSLVFALALRKRLRPPENRAFLAPASAEASRF